MPDMYGFPGPCMYSTLGLLLLEHSCRWTRVVLRRGLVDDGSARAQYIQLLAHAHTERV
jgi:hypothetical protein